MTSQVSAFDTLSEKLNAVRKAAQGITGGAGFFGFSFKTSDEAFATGTALKGTQVGEFKLTIDKLATDTTKASGTFTDASGKTVAFTSDKIGSNTVTDAGGISGLTLQLKQTTAPAITTTTTTTTTTLTGLGSVGEANKSQDTLSIKKKEDDDKKVKDRKDEDEKKVEDRKKEDDANTIKQGDRVRLTGTAIGGVDANKDFFVRLGNDNKVQLFDTLAHANGSGNTGLVDITANGDINGASISRVTTTTTTTTTTTPANTVTITVGREKFDAIAAAKDFFSAVTDALNFADSATAAGGALAGDRAAVTAATDLRRAVVGGFAAFGDGLKSKGKGNGVTLDSATVDKIINTDAGFSKVESLFRDGNGIARKVEAFSAQTLGVGGTIDTRINGLKRSSSSIDNQLEDLRVKAEDQRAKLLESFAGIASSLSSVGKQSDFISKRGQDSNGSTSNGSSSLSNPSSPLVKSTVTNTTGFSTKFLEQFRLDHPVVTANN